VLTGLPVLVSVLLSEGEKRSVFFLFLAPQEEARFPGAEEEEPEEVPDDEEEEDEALGFRDSTESEGDPDTKHRSLSEFRQYPLLFGDVRI
jgi:hypothetical protein